MSLNRGTLPENMFLGAPRKHSLLRENLNWAQDTSPAVTGQGDPRGAEINPHYLPLLLTATNDKPLLGFFTGHRELSLKLARKPSLQSVFHSAGGCRAGCREGKDIHGLTKGWTLHAAVPAR